MTKTPSRNRASRHAWILVAAICLLLSAGPAFGSGGVGDLESLGSQFLQTITEWVDSVVNLVLGDEAEGGQTANMRFEIEPNG